MSDTNGLPARLQEIVDEFGLFEGREKLEVLLEFALGMPPLPERLRDQRDAMEPVPECMTPVFIHADMEDGGMVFHFDVPAESPTVRGYAAIMSEGLRGATPQQVLTIPADFFQAMGLHEVLTFQRIKGISAILAHMKRLAAQALG